MLMPARTLFDPETQGEGSLDPLGLAMVADHLADWLLPGMTARMWRPRFLTAIAVTSVVAQPFEGRMSRDGVSPAWLLLEWYYVSAMATVKVEDDSKQLRRIPGIDKARRAVRAGIQLNADRYLKVPKVFGFHGVYKRLARHLDIVDDNLTLGANGQRLLRAWEEEEGLVGFSDLDREGGEAVKLRRSVSDAIAAAIESGNTERSPTWSGSALFTSHLLPHRLKRREADVLWKLLVTEAAPPNGELFERLRDENVSRFLAGTQSERGGFEAIRNRVSGALKARIDAIEAYESFCRPLQEVWDRLRYLSTVRSSVVRLDDLDRDERIQDLARGVGDAIDPVRGALAASPVSVEFEELARRFQGTRRPPDLTRAVWDQHVDVQHGKPPDGKRQWFEQTSDGGLIVRPAYRLEKAPPREEFIHPYRLLAVASFLEDLAGLL